MDCSTPCFLSFTISWHLLKVRSIKSVIPSNHLTLYDSLLLLPSIFPSIRVFSNESALHIRWPKYWSFSFSISPFNEYSQLFLLGLWIFTVISFRIPLQPEGLSKVFSNTTVQKHRFFSTQSSLWACMKSNSQLSCSIYFALFCVNWNWIWLHIDHYYKV